jgi:hypothetical protein
MKIFGSKLVGSSENNILSAKHSDFSREINGRIPSVSCIKQKDMSENTTDSS